MTRTVADQIAEMLAGTSPKLFYDVVGDGLDELTDALRRQGKIAWQHVRHPKAFAAFAAASDAQVTGALAVCTGRRRPANLPLINRLFDYRRCRVPIVAIAAHISFPVWLRYDPRRGRPRGKRRSSDD